MPDGDSGTDELRVALGGIVLSFAAVNDRLSLEPSERYLPFLSESSPDLVVRVRCAPMPRLELGEPLFESAGNWTLYRRNGQLILGVRALGFDPYQLVVLEPALGWGDLYCSEEAWREHDRRPLGFPIEEVLTINLLAQGRGVLLHASGVTDDGRGILFNGVSGAGKSTMAELWEDQDRVTVLSDDRVIVRQRAGQFWGYGTPWHGDARILSPAAVRLERIFLLHPADENRAVRLAPMEAVSRLLVASFPPFWDSEGMAFTLDLLNRLVDAVPCYDLGFVPDESAVGFVRCVS